MCKLSQINYIPGGISISTVKFLLLPFSCLTGAIPLTCGLLPFISDDVVSSPAGIFFVVGVAAAIAAVVDTITSLLLTMSDGSLFTATDAVLGEVGDKEGDFVVSSSILV